MSLLELFCEVDDFHQGFEAWASKQQLTQGAKRGPKCRLSASEVMTIIVHFHESSYRTLKAYYCKYVCKQLRGEFPLLVSYTRFVELMPQVLLPLCAYLQQSFAEPASALSIALRWQCVTTNASTAIKCSQA